MEKLKKIKIDGMAEYSEKEALVKSWCLETKKKIDGKDKSVVVNNITLTEQRLIISEKKDSTNTQLYTKTSFPISDIKSTYVQMGSDSLQKSIFPVLIGSILALLLLIAIFLTIEKLPVVGVILIIPFIVVIAKTVFEALDLKSQTSAKIIIKLEVVDNTMSKTIVKAYSNLSGVPQSKDSIVTLKFMVTPEAVEMAKELDNLIVETQIKKNLK